MATGHGRVTIGIEEHRKGLKEQLKYKNGKEFKAKRGDNRMLFVVADIFIVIDISI